MSTVQVRDRDRGQRLTTRRQVDCRQRLGVIAHFVEQATQAPPGLMELGLGLYGRLRYVAGRREICLFIEQVHHGNGDTPLRQLFPCPCLPFSRPVISTYRIEYAAGQLRPIDALSSSRRPMRCGCVEQKQAFAGSSAALGHGHPENPQLERDAVWLGSPGRKCDDSLQSTRPQ